MTRLRIFGAGMRGGLVADLVRWQFSDSIEIEGFYEDRELPDGKGPFDYPVLGKIEDGLAEIGGTGAQAFVAYGTKASAGACELLMRLEAADVPLASIVSPGANVFPSARIGRNALVFPGAYIGSEVAVGDLLCAHGNAVIEHHCTIGHNVLLGPGVSLSNSVNVWSHCFFGAAVSSIPETIIGCGTVVGAGAAIIEDLPPHSVAAGRPAQVLRAVTGDDEVPTKEEIALLKEKGMGECVVRE